MFVIVGWVLMLACIFGVYIAHGGNIGVILHALPFEMITIFGAAIGAFLANNQMKVVKAAMSGLGMCFKGSKFTKDRYMELLALLYDILQKVRKEGLMSIEKDVEDPHNSPLFQKYPNVGHDHHVTEFITDYLRMMVSGNLNAHEIESPDGCRDRHPPCRRRMRRWRPAGLRHRGGGAGRGEHHGLGGPAAGGAGRHDRVGPGGHLPGHSPGLRLCRAAGRPAGTEGRRGQGTGQCIKTTLLASMQGYAPQVAIEFGRKVLYSNVRPTFVELEAHVKKK
jgi:chemotaxis protein MotA